MPDLCSHLHTWLAPSHFVMLGLLSIFATAHSGLAALRLRAEKATGARAYRVVFALVSISLAVVMIGYFLSHRYDGVQLWQLQNQPWLSPVVWGLSFLSFIFLYPATFNLLEIAAIAQPQVHLYEAGIIRITRHPQMVGQVIWCIAHTLWVGSTFMVATSLGLIGYHLFAVWHGDRRLERRYGDTFKKVQAQTSVIPFLAILQGRQTFAPFELVRPAYLGVIGFIFLFWWAHPLMMRAGMSIHC